MGTRALLASKASALAPSLEGKNTGNDQAPNVEAATACHQGHRARFDIEAHRQAKEAEPKEISRRNYAAARINRFVATEAPFVWEHIDECEFDSMIDAEAERKGDGLKLMADWLREHPEAVEIEHG